MPAGAANRPAAGPSSGSATLGRLLTLKPCRQKRPAAECGAIRVPLYWRRPREGNLTVHFEDFPHTDRAAAPLEPIVAMEGGPGYPSIGSASYYRFMLGPLLERHNLILMDQRGTGLSGPIYCRRLQNYFALARPEGYPQAAAACARQLGAAANAYGRSAASSMVSVPLLPSCTPSVSTGSTSMATPTAATPPRCSLCTTRLS